MMMSYEEMDMLTVEREKRLYSLDRDSEDYYQKVQEICEYYDEMFDDSRGGYREDGD